VSRHVGAGSARRARTSREVRKYRRNIAGADRIYHARLVIDCRGPSVKSSGHGDLLARQARRHLELPFGDQQLAVVVKGMTRRFGAVIPIETGLD